MKKIEFVNGTTIDGASTFNQIQDNIEDVFNGEEAMGKIVVDDVECKNKFNKYDVSIGQLNINDGTINTSITTYVTSNFIKVSNGQSHFISTADWFQICYYDSNKNFISGTTYQTTLGDATIAPTNASYMRMSTGINSVDTTQIEKGDKFTSYTPHKKFGFEDSGWRTPTLLNDWQVANANYDTVQYRKIGNIVYIRGVILRNEPLDGNDVRAVFTLPDEFRPLKSIAGRVNGVSYNIENGLVYFGEYGGYTSGSWLTLNGISFFVD